MLGKRSDQLGLYEADNQYLKFVGKDSFYGYLAQQRGKLFNDEEFGAFYCEENGRPSVPPSMLAIALLLQTYDKVSDEEAKARADFDLRWKVALGIEIETKPFAKSTLQLFRAQLILKEKMQEVFVRSLELAKQTEYFKKRSMKVVLDTTYILGRGAVKDTYNLLGEGIQQLCRALAEREKQKLVGWVNKHQFEKYFQSSLKGEANIDWDDEEARSGFLHKVIDDARRLMHLAKEISDTQKSDSPAMIKIAEAGQLLNQLIDQDVEVEDGKSSIKQGVSRDRIISVQDPDMRHGRKSSAKRFNGHKVAIAVDPDSQLITAVEIIPGNASDATPTLSLTEASENNTEIKVDETVGDCAYGNGSTRKKFSDANRKLVAKVPNTKRKGMFDKSEFDINLVIMSCTCPAGHTTLKQIRTGYYRDENGKKLTIKSFSFPKEICASCTLKSQCYKSEHKEGRKIRIHPQEKLMQEARAFQQSPAYQPYKKMRQSVEHRLARLVQLGIRQARYFGRRKTLFQALMAATVANLTLLNKKSALVAA